MQRRRMVITHNDGSKIAFVIETSSSAAADRFGEALKSLYNMEPGSESAWELLADLRELLAVPEKASLREHVERLLVERTDMDELFRELEDPPGAGSRREILEGLIAERRELVDLRRARTAIYDALNCREGDEVSLIEAMKFDAERDQKALEEIAKAVGLARDLPLTRLVAKVAALAALVHEAETVVKVGGANICSRMATICSALGVVDWDDVPKKIGQLRRERNNAVANKDALAEMFNDIRKVLGEHFAAPEQFAGKIAVIKAERDQYLARVKELNQYVERGKVLERLAKAVGLGVASIEAIERHVLQALEDRLNLRAASLTHSAMLAELRDALKLEGIVTSEEVVTKFRHKLSELETVREDRDALEKKLMEIARLIPDNFDSPVIVGRLSRVVERMRAFVTHVKELESR